MASEIDPALLLDIFFVLAIAIVCYITLWVVAKWRATRVPASDVLTVKNLFSELTTITNWYQLGVYLNLQTHELDKIQQDHAYHGNDRQRLEMLRLWLRRTPNATWDDVVSALQQMGEDRVAENIRQKRNRRAGKPLFLIGLIGASLSEPSLVPSPRPLTSNKGSGDLQPIPRASLS